MGKACGTCGKTEIHILMGKPGDHLEDLGLDGKIILKCILNKQGVEREGGRRGLGLSGLRQGEVWVLLDAVVGLPNSVNAGNFLTI